MSAVEELNSEDTSPLKGPAPKALPEDTSDVDKNEDIMPLTSPGDQPVQFVPGQPANGDAKVEIGGAATGPAFVGLGKEELMKYANDPFWVRLRWFLFILFWVIWVAMLVGAIVIIVLAPKCAAKTDPNESYYELNVKNFAKDGKVSDLNERVSYLSDLGVTSVIISDVLKKEGGGTADFKNVDESLGTLSEFSDAIQKLKNAGMRVLLTLTPNHSGTKHEWFTDPEHQFEDYYVHKHQADVFGSTWKAIDGNPGINAWAIDPKNGSVRYLQQFNRQADLNFLNQKVVDEMTGVFSFWKGKGIDAFLIQAASYLVEDLNQLTNQAATKNQPENVGIVKTILNKQPGDRPSLVEVVGLNEKDSAQYIESGIIPLINDYDISRHLDQYSEATAKFRFFKLVHDNHNAVIRLSGPTGRLQGQNEDDANVIRLFAYSSNASVILHYGDEVDDFDTTSNSMNWETASTLGRTYQFLKKLSQTLRSLVDNPEHTGFSYPYKGDNKFVVAFVRSNKYIVIGNFGASAATVDFGELLDNAETKATVIVATPNAAEGLKEGSELTGSVTLPARSGVLLQKKD